MKLGLKYKMNLFVISFLIIWVAFISVSSIYTSKNNIIKIKEYYSKKSVKSISLQLSREIDQVRENNLMLENTFQNDKKIEKEELIEKNIDNFYIFDNNKNLIYNNLVVKENESFLNLDPTTYLINKTEKTGIDNINGVPAIISMKKHMDSNTYISIRILNKQRLGFIEEKNGNPIIFMFLDKNNKHIIEDVDGIGDSNIGEVYNKKSNRPSNIVTSFIINSYFQNPTINIEYNFDKGVTPLINRYNLEYAMLIAIINIIFLVIFIYLLNAKVFNRLEKIQCEIDKVGENSVDLSEDKDEIQCLEDNVSNVINSLSSFKEQVDFYSKYDNLTGLMKREIFVYEGDRYIEENKDCNVALIYINLDGFSNYNNNYGYVKGDEILGNVAKILEKNVFKDSFLARIGGDEFGILIKNINKEDNIEEYIKTLIRDINTYKINESYDQFISASIGISMSNTNSTTAFELLNDAYLAMVSVKERVKNSYEFFEDFLKNHITTDMMYNGIKNGEIQLYYQPKVNSINNRIDGVEALARWFHPTIGYIPPVKFIKVAEETGYIINLGSWVLSEACRQIKEINDKYNTNVKVAVNVSSIQFMQKDFVDIVKEVLNKWDFKPNNLELELTESIGVYNSTEVISKFEEINELGISIAIDDFGTGYSSFKYLQQYRVNTIKIDRSFVQEVEKDSGIIKSIIELSHNLGFKVVAEGIENFAQSQKLKQLECDYFQGYFFYKPISIGSLSEVIEKYEIVRY